MNKIFKYILIMKLFYLVSIVNFSAITLDKRDLGYYFTFLLYVGRNFSDKTEMIIVDGEISYCIEPGKRMGTNMILSSLEDLGYSSSTIERIYDLSLYGFNHLDDPLYYIAP